MSDERAFPDISFVDSDALAILSEMIAGYEAETGRTLYPADPVRVLLNYVAAVISQERAKINDSAKMNVPRFARGDYLDSLAEIFRGVERLEAVPAECMLIFSISSAQDTGVIIPAGTRATADGSITFSTVSDIVIPAGEVSGAVKAVCDIPGTVGNGYLAGQIKSCVDISLIPRRSRISTLPAAGLTGNLTPGFTNVCGKAWRDIRQPARLGLTYIMRNLRARSSKMLRRRRRLPGTWISACC